MESASAAGFDLETTGLWLASTLLLLLLLILQIRNSGWEKRARKAEAQSNRDARVERLLGLMERASAMTKPKGKSNRPLSKAKRVPLARSGLVAKTAFPVRRKGRR